MLVILFLILSVLSPVNSNAAYTVAITPLGVNVLSSDAAINWYESYWGFSFSGIDFNRIDDFLLGAMQHYGYSGPIDLKIVLRPPTDCIDDGSDNFEIKCGTICCTACVYTWQKVMIGLMPNNSGIRDGQTGQGPNAFCDTALDHELSHVILHWMNDPCAWLGESGRPECAGLGWSAYQSGLCH